MNEYSGIIKVGGHKICRESNHIAIATIGIIILVVYSSFSPNLLFLFYNSWHNTTFFSAVLILSGFLKDLISSLGHHTKPHTTQLSGKRICPPSNYTIPSNIIGMKSYHLSKNPSTKDIYIFPFFVIIVLSNHPFYQQH